MEDWRVAYKKRFGVDVQIYAPYVYDAVMTMAQAMKDAGSADPAKYLPYLAKVKYKGITGNIEFDKNGDMKTGTLTLYSYKGGKREEVAVIH
jgi:branched-chain amino acid transport system substrate-binding protein